jgi:hypothetical protein
MNHAKASRLLAAIDAAAAAVIKADGADCALTLLLARTVELARAAHISDRSVVLTLEDIQQKTAN